MRPDMNVGGVEVGVNERFGCIATPGFDTLALRLHGIALSGQRGENLPVVVT